jgi:hypothetical protein
MPQDIEKEIESAERNGTNVNRRSYLKMVGTGAGFTAGGTGLTSLGTRSVRATQESPCNVVDDFEDTDLSEYEFDRGKSGASLVTSPTYSGAYALEISGTNTEMISMNGLDHYPAAGDVFSTWVRGTNNADRINITYGVQNHLNRYFARVNPEQGHVALYRYEDGNGTLLADKGVPLSQDTWYEVQIEWQTDGTHVFTLFDESGGQVAQISATDSTWTAGGIGYDAYLGDGGTVYFDHTQIHSGRKIVSANEVIDSFEDSGLSEYDFDRGSSGANIVSDTTYAGSSVLEISGTNTEMISKSGLDHYPSAGDVFSCWVRGTGGPEDVHFTYGVQDHESRYFARIDIANNDLFLFKYHDGNFDQLGEDASVSLAEDTWYNIEVDWRKTGTHIVTLYDCDGKEVAQITGSDSTWTDGGIGYDAYLEASGGTVYFDYVAIHSSVLDDFEDGDLSEYSGDTGSFTIQNSTVLEGDQTLKGMSVGSAVSHTEVKTTRGQEYRTSVMAGSDTGGRPAIMVSVQNPSQPLENCYYLEADTANDKLSLYRRDDASSVRLATEGVALDEGVTYELRLELGRNTVLGEIRDGSGTALKAVGAFDNKLSGGHLGFYLAGGAPGYFDNPTEHPMVENVLDNFEENNVDEYVGDTSYYSVQSSETLQGSNSLKGGKNYTGVTHTNAETPRGQEYRSLVMSGSGSGSRPSLLACVQTPKNPIEDCYWAQVSPDNNNLNLFRRDGGSTTVLDRVDVNVEEGTEYQLGLELRENEVKANLYTEHGRKLTETNSVNDTTFAAGNFGFYTGGSGAPAYYDHVTKQELSTTSATDVSEGDEGVTEALNTTLAQQILNELNNPSVDKSGATRRNYYRNETAFDYSFIHVPMEYGEIQVGYKNREVSAVLAKLNRSAMSDSLIAELSDDFDWPNSADGYLLNTGSFGEPKFTRTVTDSEKTDVIDVVSNYDDRSDEPSGIVARNNDGGEYRALFWDKFYHVDVNRTEVTNDESRIGSPSQCDQKNALCLSGAADITASCSLGAAACLGTIATPIPGDEVILCGAGVYSCGNSVTSTYATCSDAGDCN